MPLCKTLFSETDLFLFNFHTNTFLLPWLACLSTRKQVSMGRCSSQNFLIFPVLSGTKRKAECHVTEDLLKKCTIAQLKDLVRGIRENDAKTPCFRGFATAGREKLTIMLLQYPHIHNYYDQV